MKNHAPSRARGKLRVWREKNMSVKTSAKIDFRSETRIPEGKNNDDAECNKIRQTLG